MMYIDVYQEKKRRQVGGTLTSMQFLDKSHFLRPRDKSAQQSIEDICSSMNQGGATLHQCSRLYKAHECP